MSCDPTNHRMGNHRGILVALATISQGRKAGPNNRLVLISDGVTLSVARLVRASTLEFSSLRFRILKSHTTMNPEQELCNSQPLYVTGSLSLSPTKDLQGDSLLWSGEPD